MSTGITTNVTNTTALFSEDTRNTNIQQNIQEHERIILENNQKVKNGASNAIFPVEGAESKSTLVIEGRSNREMTTNTNASDHEGHKILSCNITIKHEESTIITTTLTDNDETTTDITTETTPPTTTLISNESTTITSTLPTTSFTEEFYGNETTEIDATTVTEVTTTAAAITTTLPITTTNGTVDNELNLEKILINDTTKNVTPGGISGNETQGNDTQIQERIVPTDSSDQVTSAFPDDVITLDPESDLDIERTEITTEHSNGPITVQTDSTFMTLIPTTVIMPEELDVVNITLHKNVSIVESDNSSTTVNGSLLPVRAIPPEIEAILNITQKKDEDYEYDYNEPSLPPSLPGVRIIPFVAADAVVEDKNSPTVYPKDKHRPTDNPVFYKVSHPNLFSPPVETE
ncbi:uncharacterized protein GBIM_02064, partial [Gryllus bimaculatus]